MKKFFNSFWYAITVGVIFVATFILLGGGTVPGVIYIVGLTACWALERVISKMWRDAAYDMLEDM